MGNILQDMMGLLSRKKVVTESEPTDFILLGRTPNPEDSMFVTPKMNNQLISIKDLKAQFDAGEISGGGTVNTIPIFTPDGTTLGDSIMSQNASGTRIGIGTTNPQRELDVFGGIRVRGPLDLFQQNDNSFAGQNAGNWYNIVGNKNTAFGKNSQSVQVNGSGNTSAGYDSMALASFGNLNVAVGDSAMASNDGGSFNTAVGAKALQDQEAGQGNTAIGYNSLNNKDQSNFNTAVGHTSLFNVSTGFKNIGIGDNVGSTLSTGSKNVLIGSNADVQSANNTNSIVIGESSLGNGSNTVTLGNNNITDTYLKGNVIFPATITAGGSIGTAGQILSSTSTSVEWIDASDTLAEVLTNGNTTDGNNINFGDGDEAIFGTGNDLRIYHNGTNSYIADAGTGDLIISATNFQVNDTVTGERFISAQSNADVKLYFDSDLKLATVTDGVSITGKVTDLTDPTDPQDAATKAYVDAQSGGLTQTTGTVTPTLTAGISGLTYLIQTGYWTRIGDIVNVYINVNIGTFTKTDPNIRLTIDDVFPYDIDSSRFFFNSDIMRYTNISNSGTAIPALYVLEPSTTGSYPYSIFFGQSSNYSLGSGNYIITDNMSTGGFDLVFSFTYKATGNTLRAGATID